MPEFEADEPRGGRKDLMQELLRKQELLETRIAKLEQVNAIADAMDRFKKYYISLALAIAGVVAAFLAGKVKW